VESGVCDHIPLSAFRLLFVCRLDRDLSWQCLVYRHWYLIGFELNPSGAWVLDCSFCVKSLETVRWAASCEIAFSSSCVCSGLAVLDHGRRLFRIKLTLHWAVILVEQAFVSPQCWWWWVHKFRKMYILGHASGGFLSNSHCHIFSKPGLSEQIHLQFSHSNWGLPPSLICLLLLHIIMSMLSVHWHKNPTNNAYVSSTQNVIYHNSYPIPRSDVDLDHNDWYLTLGVSSIDPVPIDSGTS
jgi:hypothetical protein